MPRDELLGKALGQYKILEEIGRGGMADVYRAYQPSLNRYVAIKVLPPEYARDNVFVERFLQEARTAARLEHPNIVPIYEAAEQAGLYYIVMRYLEGETLKQLIEREGALPLPRVRRIVAQLAEALDYAHSHDVVHRDIKPSNIFVGNKDHVTLADFGIARAAEATHLTRTGTLIGTPEYMSPEQARGEEIDWRTDIYSLGIVVYEMLAGRPPFTGDTATVLHAHAYERPAPLQAVSARIPAAAGRVVERSLAKTPQQRYGTAGKMAGELKRALAGKMVEEPTTLVAPVGRRRVLSSPVLMGTLVALALLIGGIVVMSGATHQPTATSAALATSTADPIMSPTLHLGVALTPEGEEPVVQSMATASSLPTKTPSLAPIPPTVTSRPMIGTTSQGARIAFVSDRDGNNEIYVMDTDGSNQVNLTRNSAADEHPSWSPDGTRIAFTSKREGNFEIYTMMADGSAPTNLSHNPSDDWGPSWSPDGRRIAYMSWRDNNNEIYIVDTGGTNQTRLTHNQAEDHWPSWSPDGTRMVFMSDRDGNWEIYVMDADGSGQRNLTRHWSADFYPSWSPDGRQIGFVSDRDGNDEVYVMNADGSGPTNLSSNSADDWAPSWSPDGRQLAFVSSRHGNDEIYIMNADGSGQTRLTDNWPTNDWDPSWSVK